MHTQICTATYIEQTTMKWETGEERESFSWSNGETPVAQIKVKDGQWRTGRRIY